LAQEVTLLKSWGEKIDHLLATLPKLENKTEYYKAVCKAIFLRLKAAAAYEWNTNKRIKSHTTLLKPISPAFKIEEDYGLSKVGISLFLYVCMYVCIMGGPHSAPALRPSLICCVSPFSVNPLLNSHCKLNL
jgi:hypothetical protein